jgi:hypothetical protein
MIVYMLVAVILAQGQPPSYTVPAAQPFFRTLAECQAVVREMANAPPIVAEITCQRVSLDMATGRTTKVQ